MKKSVMMLLSCVLLLAVLLSACSAKNSPEKQLEAALNQLFLGPNAAYVSFIQDTLPSLGLESIPAEEVQSTIQSEVMNAVLQANEEGGALPEYVLEQCWADGFYEIHSLCVGNNWQIELSDVEITPTEIETILVFTANILCTKDGEKVEIPVSGQASFDGEEIISISFTDGLVELVEALE